MSNKEDKIRVFAQCCGRPVEAIEKMAMKIDGFSFQDLKIDEIKKIIRHYKREGYYMLSVQANKSALVKNLDGIITGTLTTSDSKPAGSSSSMPPPAILQPNLVTERRRPDNPSPKKKQRPMDTSLHQLNRVFQQEIDEFNANSFLNNKESNKSAPHPFFLPQIADPDSQIVLSTNQKKKIFYELVAQPGVTKTEALDAISHASPAEMNSDSLLLYIVSNRKENPLFQISQGQEAEDMDRAILASESEREVIQDRKKQRIEQLHKDWNISLSTAEEFRSSVLLFGLNLTNQKGNPLTKKSETLSHLVSFLDLNNNNTSQKLESKSRTHSSLRDNVVNLLLLESTAYKYYKQESIPYFLRLGAKIDHRILDRLKSNLSSFEAWVKSSSEGSSSKGQVDQDILSLVNDILSLLDKLEKKLERGMYKMPTDGELVPLIFRKSSLRPFMKLIGTTVDDDGFEMIDDEPEEVSTEKLVSEENVDLASSSESENGEEEESLEDL